MVILIVEAGRDYGDIGWFGGFGFARVQGSHCGEGIDAWNCGSEGRFERIFRCYANQRGIHIEGDAGEGQGLIVLAGSARMRIGVLVITAVPSIGQPSLIQMALGS